MLHLQKDVICIQGYLSTVVQSILSTMNTYNSIKKTGINIQIINPKI